MIMKQREKTAGKGEREIVQSGASVSHFPPLPTVEHISLLICKWLCLSERGGRRAADGAGDTDSQSRRGIIKASALP